MKNFLNKNNFPFGVFLGLVFPIPLAFIFGFMLHLAQSNLHVVEKVKDIDMLLLAVAMNFLLVRFYIKKKQYLQTAKGLFLISTILVLVYFFTFQKINFAFPF